MSFQMDRQKMYVMPIQFGPCLGPRQNSEGKRYLYEYPRTVVNHTLVYESVSEAIEPFLPPRVTLDSPYVIINHRMNRNLSWLAGHGYNLISVRVPATFHGEEEQAKGYFMLSIWENETDPIIFGREQLGYCKTFADISDVSEPDNEGCTRASADSWGFRFLELEFQWNQGTPAQKELHDLMYDPTRQGDMNYKYIPQTGDGFTGCDAAYMTLTPKVTSYPEDVQTFPSPEIVYGSGTLVWHRPRWEDMPTQFRIVQGLESLPVKRFLGAYRTTAQSLNDSFDQRIVR